MLPWSILLTEFIYTSSTSTKREITLSWWCYSCIVLSPTIDILKYCEDFEEIYIGGVTIAAAVAVTIVVTNSGGVGVVVFIIGAVFLVGRHA